MSWKGAKRKNGAEQCCWKYKHHPLLPFYLVASPNHRKGKMFLLFKHNIEPKSTKHRERSKFVFWFELISDNNHKENPKLLKNWNDKSHYSEMEISCVINWCDLVVKLYFEMFFFIMRKNIYFHIKSFSRFLPLWDLCYYETAHEIFHYYVVYSQMCVFFRLLIAFIYNRFCSSKTHLCFIYLLFHCAVVTEKKSLSSCCGRMRDSRRELRQNMCTHTA